MSVTHSVDVIRRPLPTLNMAAAHDFQQVAIQGVTLAVDAVARDRISTARELANAGEAAIPAIPHLIEMIGQDRVSGSVNTDDLVEALTRGNATQDDGRQIENMAHIGEADLACQVAAQEALTTLGAPAAPALIEALRSPVTNQRNGAANALGNMGAAAEGALPSLKDLTNDASENVRKAAADAVKKIKPQGRFSF